MLRYFLLQDIKFPLMLDVFDLCSESLQQKLMPAREKFKAEEDKRVEKAAKVGNTVIMIWKSSTIYSISWPSVCQVLSVIKPVTDCWTCGTGYHCYDLYLDNHYP